MPGSRTRWLWGWGGSVCCWCINGNFVWLQPGILKILLGQQALLSPSARPLHVRGGPASIEWHCAMQQTSRVEWETALCFVLPAIYLQLFRHRNYFWLFFVAVSENTDKGRGIAVNVACGLMQHLVAGASRGALRCGHALCFWGFMRAESGFLWCFLGWPPDLFILLDKAVAAVMSLCRGKRFFSLEKGSNAGEESCISWKQEFQQLFKIDVILETTEGKSFWLQFKKTLKCMP